MGLSVLEEDIRQAFTATASPGAALIEVVADISQACNIAVEILNDLLMYEKIEGGLIQLEKEEVEVAPFVTEVLKLFSVQAKALNIDIVFQNPLDSRVFAQLDNYKMSQVLRNLISNALKFSKPGGSIIISLEMVDDRAAFNSPEREASFRNPSEKEMQTMVRDFFKSKSFSSSFRYFTQRISPMSIDRITTYAATNTVRINVQDFGAGISAVSSRASFMDICSYIQCFSFTRKIRIDYSKR
jgi:signal transduction histidine kinase